ncbi:hypothetical protein COY32_01395 [candidate division WWE3 bacterium CG_4_10_14_0_2_um_filter_41_14]|uniref:Methyltransferase domain-containing protein n=1 Tax=candidate division WWE3 bacterium CG_4_10_14_0_2_um_filter_41_14 TaxID=1975072 RepID=A0A2M7TLS0_UNCKA|nr:MAG: hypothetical protein COY32_01395 [candidate division WWE3 bacterium CG_4_10_14_0_2_um_filter_41_14]
MSKRTPPMAPPPVEKKSLRKIETTVGQNLETLIDPYEHDKQRVGTALVTWHQQYAELKQAEAKQNGSEGIVQSARLESLDREVSMMSSLLDDALGISIIGDTQPETELLQRLSTDDTFDGIGNLTAFLGYRLWREKNIFLFARNNKDSQDRYSTFREIVSPFIQESLVTLATLPEEGHTTLRETLEQLVTSQEKNIALEAIIDESTPPAVKLTLTVELMNTSGVVTTIESLLPHVESNPDVAQLVKTIQGSTGNEVMASLSSVYNAIEFQEYAVNNEDLTKREAQLIAFHVEAYAKKHNRDPHEVRIADIGAGTGRLAIALHHDGFDVTAFEYEQKHIQYMSETAPEMAVEEADWHHMPIESATVNSQSPEIFYCLGRTILHNNTPEKMARFFDEMHRILSDGGIGIIDIPNLREDDGSPEQYDQNITEFANHLASLGVRMEKSQNIFDGPDDDHRFNRMTLTNEQFKTYARLFGFTVEQTQVEQVGEDSQFENAYYTIKKQPNFEIADIPTNELLSMLYGSGLYHPGVDYNQHVDAWGVPLGTPFVYAQMLPGVIEDIREQEIAGTTSAIRVEVHNGSLTFRM